MIVRRMSPSWMTSPTPTRILSMRPPWSVRTGISIFIDSKSEEHTSELQSLMRTSYAVFCLKKTKIDHHTHSPHATTTLTNIKNNPHLSIIILLYLTQPTRPLRIIDHTYNVMICYIIQQDHAITTPPPTHHLSPPTVE